MIGYGERFSHRLALPPTKSTAIIQGGTSEGIGPVYANVYGQDTAGGTVFRINPVLLPIMKDRGQYTEAVMERIAKAQGSVQGESWLTDHEKEVFRTAYEINQETILLMGSHRQRIMSAGGGGQDPYHADAGTGLYRNRYHLCAAGRHSDHLRPISKAGGKP